MSRKQATRPIFSTILDDGRVVETLFDLEKIRTFFAVLDDGEITLVDKVSLSGERLLVPFSPENNLLTHEVVLLPSEVGHFNREDELLEEVRSFIHRYVDLSEEFEELAAHYVLFTWFFDQFNELPYLRVRGDIGSGKSRFLLTLGSLVYKPIFASGASTVSPLFRMIDAVGGTLLIDEGDFRFSDEKSEIAKILNNGNARGFPVLRTELTAGKEFNPRAFNVFGPKVIATRGYFDDRALESRCITETMGKRKLRNDIPLNLPEAFKTEAREIRNKLLALRFRKWSQGPRVLETAHSALEPRVSQVFAPLLAGVGEGELRTRLLSVAEERSNDILLERSLEPEAELLSVVKELLEGGEDLYLKDIAKVMQKRFGENYDYRINPRWVGTMLRKRLFLTPTKSHGNFMIPLAEYPKLEVLFARYGV